MQCPTITRSPELGQKLAPPADPHERTSLAAPRIDNYITIVNKGGVSRRPQNQLGAARTSRRSDLEKKIGLRLCVSKDIQELRRVRTNTIERLSE